ncbi:MAG: response regulator [Candidatus Omnitrophica bacterium]|nr:response regulator [Candidatus Omnitrophota bacterium]
MQKKKVLIVDDVKVIGIALKMILNENGYLTDSATDGYEALEKIKKNTFDIALVDIVMPGIDGIRTWKEIKKISPLTRCIFISGYCEDAFEGGKRFIEQIDKDCSMLCKPFSDEELINTIENSLKEAN